MLQIRKLSTSWWGNRLYTAQWEFLYWPGPSERCSEKAPFVLSDYQHPTSCFIHLPLLQGFAEPYHWRVNCIHVTVTNIFCALADNTHQKLCPWKRMRSNLWFLVLVHTRVLAVDWLLRSSWLSLQQDIVIWRRIDTSTVMAGWEKAAAAALSERNCSVEGLANTQKPVFAYLGISQGINKLSRTLQLVAVKWRRAGELKGQEGCVSTSSDF